MTNDGWFFVACGASVISFLIGIGISISETDEMIKQAIDHGYAIYAPDTGEFMWLEKGVINDK